jgi:tetratricopeptide (TPR) repeat protein
VDLRSLISVFRAGLSLAILFPLAMLCHAQGPLSRQQTPSSQRPADQTGNELAADARQAAQAELQSGIALTRRGLFAEAIPHFLAARSQVSNEYAVNFNLALCYVGTRQFKPAIQILRDLNKGDHATPDVDNLLAQAYIGNAQPQEGLESFQRAATETPQDEKLYLFVADACTDQQNYDLGLKIVEIGLQNLPDSPRLHYKRAIFFSQLGESDQAREDFDLVQKLTSGSKTAYLSAGQEKLFEGNIPEAIRVAREGIKRGYGNYILLTILGEALIRSGATPGQPDFSEAQVVLEKSVAERPNHSGSQLALGKVYLMANRLDDAITHLEKARALDPRNPSVYSNLATAYRRKGELQQAQAILTTLARINAEQAEKIASAPGDRKASYGQVIH